MLKHSPLQLKCYVEVCTCVCVCVCVSVCVCVCPEVLHLSRHGCSAAQAHNRTWSKSVLCLKLSECAGLVMPEQDT